MKSLFGASLTFTVAALSSLSAAAADLPQVKLSDANAVPACATPGRLTAYLRVRNPKLDSRFESVATEYKRLGEELGIRWDIAFFQMILETGALRFGGDVRASQNNFAGLGASGGGAHGESFGDISLGVKAHLQHLLMYSGEHIAEPVADRTRKVQEWGVLTKWQKSINGPMTYTLVAQQWAPTSRNYVRDLSTITDGFYNQYCDAADPQPEMVDATRDGAKPKSSTQVVAKTTKTPVPDPSVPATDETLAATDTPASNETQVAVNDAQPAGETKAPGAEIAKKSIEDERKVGPPRTGLGAGSMLGNLGETAKAAADQQQATKAPADGPPVTLLNPKPDATAEATSPADAPVTTNTAAAPKADTKSTDAKAAPTKTKVAEPKSDSKATAKSEPSKSDAKATAKPDTKTAKADAKADNKAAAQTDTADKDATEKSASAEKATVQTASIAGSGAATQLKTPSKAAPKCKVWTASYGGQRAVIIKANGGGTTNYTVLDVTDTNEKREVDAYIAAYAKGGQQVGSFATQTKALNKAFELCPEG